MTTYSLAGSFGWAGGGKSGATVDIWATSRFTGFPVQNQAPPSGSADAGPVTTGDTSGNPGGYEITGITTVQDYYVRIEYGGQTYWGLRTAASLGGVITPSYGVTVAMHGASIPYSTALGERTIVTDGTFTDTLATPAANSECWITNQGSGVVTVAAPAGADLFNMSGSVGNITLSQGEGFHFVCNGAGWFASA